MIALYSSIEQLRTSGFKHIALTMLKTLPARPIAAAYSSAEGAGGLVDLDQPDVRHANQRCI